jgi:hypothetical protein
MARPSSEIADFHTSDPRQLEAQLQAFQRNVGLALGTLLDEIRKFTPNVRELSVSSPQSERSLRPYEILLWNTRGWAASPTIVMRASGVWTSVVVNIGNINAALVGVIDESTERNRRVARIPGVAGLGAAGLRSGDMRTVLCDGRDFWVEGYYPNP